MNWSQPSYIFLIILPLIAFYLLWRWSRWKKQVRLNFADAELQKNLFGSELKPHIPIRPILLIISMIFLVFAYMGPQWGNEKQTLRREGIDIVFALDLSYSMYAEDISPNRVEKAKEFIFKYMQTLGGDRVGLVIFAGEAYQVAPLTHDYHAIELFLDGLDPNTLWSQGTSLSTAIDNSLEMLGNQPDTGKAIVIISDGENHEEGIEKSVENAIQNQTEIVCIGVGKNKPTPIPIRSDDGRELGFYKTDGNGNTVMTEFHGEVLKGIAQQAGGAYFKLKSIDNTVKKLTQTINTLEKKSASETTALMQKEQFQWFVGISILFLLMFILTPSRDFFKK